MIGHWESRLRRTACLIALGALGALTGACSQLPAAGPTRDEVQQAPRQAAELGMVQLVDIDARVARQLAGKRSRALFSQALDSRSASAARIGLGDVIEVTIWESPPATLFTPGSADPRGTAAAGATTLPAQPVDAEGFISVPFAGRIKADGLTPQAVGEAVVARLKGKANHPEVLVRVVRHESSAVTVVGEVQQSLRMPLATGRERLLDALAAAGGVRQPVNKISLQVTRSGSFHTLPLDLIIRDPNQNVLLAPGDVVTALHQPLSFNVLGSTGRQDEIAFEANGISLAQALARAGGLLDNRSNPEGLFIFRFEERDALEWPGTEIAATPDGKVAVVYRMNLRDPKSFFVMQGFAMQDKDLLYVSNAPAAELQKFLNVVFSAVFPVVNLINATN